jgi:hypothetical protein
MTRRLRTIALALACSLVGCGPRPTSPVAPASPMRAEAREPALVDAQTEPAEQAEPAARWASDFEFVVTRGAMGVAAKPDQEKPVAYSKGSATVSLRYRMGSGEKSVEIEQIDLASHGAYGNGERFSLDAQGKIIKRHPEDLGESVLAGPPAPAFSAHMPANTLASVGVIHFSERAWFLFHVYHLVKSGNQGYQVLRQTWNSATGEIDEADTRVVKELDP